MTGFALALLLAGGVPRPEPPRTPVAEPYRQAGEEPLDFRGPGRDAPEPEGSDVAVGWFGPGDPDHPEFGDFWRGATLALEQENAAGGYCGAGAVLARPFRLLPVWSENPWQAGISDLTRLVYERGLWAVIGGVDGTTTHLALQSALKSWFLLLTPGSSDPTTDHANVPWLFSLPPSDDAQAPVIADALARLSAGGRFAIAAATDHDSHAALVAMRRRLAERRLAPSATLEFPPAEPELAPLARRLAAGRPAALLVLAPSRAAGRLVAELRRAGHTGPIVGGSPMARAAFRRVAGQAAEGVLVPVSVANMAGDLARAYARRWTEPPDEAAVQSYDAVRLTAAAVREAGLNRARIRDAVRALSPWAGAGGTVDWDARGRNRRPVRLGVWAGDRLKTSASD